MDLETVEFHKLVDYLVHKFLGEGWHFAVWLAYDCRRKGTDVFIDRRDVMLPIQALLFSPMTRERPSVRKRRHHVCRWSAKRKSGG